MVFDQVVQSVLSYIQDCDSPAEHRMTLVPYFLLEQGEWQLEAHSGVHLVVRLVLA